MAKSFIRRIRVSSIEEKIDAIENMIYDIAGIEEEIEEDKEYYTPTELAFWLGFCSACQYLDEGYYVLKVYSIHEKINDLYKELTGCETRFINTSQYYFSEFMASNEDEESFRNGVDKFMEDFFGGCGDKEDNTEHGLFYAILKAYKEQEEEGFSSNERDGIMGYEIPHHYTFLS